jgi:hypothetical protein
MEEGQRDGLVRHAKPIAIVVATLALASCGAFLLLPRAFDASDQDIRSVQDLAAAYARVQPGATHASQLARLGFDASMPNVQALSALGVMERFMTGDSAGFDRLDAALQRCIDAQDRCTAYVFKPSDPPSASDNGLLGNLGFGAATAAGRVPEVTLLVENGRVAYKMITGMPPAPDFDRRAAATSPPQLRAAVDLTAKPGAAAY